MVKAILDSNGKGSRHILADLGLPGGEGLILNDFVQPLYILQHLCNRPLIPHTISSYFHSKPHSTLVR